MVGHSITSINNIFYNYFGRVDINNGSLVEPDNPMSISKGEFGSIWAYANTNFTPLEENPSVAAVIMHLELKPKEGANGLCQSPT